MRSLTTLQSLEMARKTGAEPVLLIVVELGGSYGNINFSDKELTYSGVHYVSKILTVSDFHSQEKIGGIGTIDNLSVTVIDSDQTYRNSINLIRWVGKNVSVYHYFVGSEPLLILKGKVATPFEWDDATRQLTFDILTNNTQQDVTCVVDPNATDVNPDTAGKNIPICFGTVIDLEVPKAIKPVVGKLLDAIQVVDISTVPVASGSFKVENADAFPQSTSLDIIIGGHVLTGSFLNGTFTITGYKVDNINFVNAMFGPDGKMSKIRTTYIPKNIVGVTIIMKQPYTANVSTTHSTYSDQPYIVMSQKTVYVGTIKYLELTLDRPVTQSAFDATITGTLIYPPDGGSTITIRPRFTVLQPGTPVFRSGHTQEVYLINCGTTISSLLSVKAYKNLEVNKVKKKYLIEVPPEYYTFNSVYTFGSDTDLSSLVFAQPLSTVDADWEDTIYVSMTSSVGPNIADILKWLLEHYSDCTINLPSYTTYKTLIDKYPANFALLDSKEVFSLCAEIAYQARSVLYNVNNQIYFKYLSVEPSATKTITDLDNIEGKMVMELSPIEEIFTHLEAKWKENYSPETKEKVLNFKNNVDVFGYHKQEQDYYIFRTESLVRKSLTFWGNRKSNQWLKAKITTFLTTIDTEIYDCIQCNMTLITSKSIVYNIEHNSNDFEIHLDVWFPIVGGTGTKSLQAWLTDSGDVKPSPLTVTKGTVPQIDAIVSTTTTAMGSSNSVPELILCIVTSQLGSGYHTVDLYEQGFEFSPTRTNITAHELKGDDIDVDTKTTVAFKNGKYFLAKGSGLDKLSTPSGTGTPVSNGALAPNEKTVTLDQALEVVVKSGTPVLALNINSIYVTDGTNTFKLSDIFEISSTGLSIKTGGLFSDGTNKRPLSIIYDSISTKFMALGAIYES